MPHLIQKDPTGNGHHTPIDITEGEYGADAINARTAARAQQFFKAIQADSLAQRTPGDAPKVAQWPEDNGAPPPIDDHAAAILASASKGAK